MDSFKVIKLLILFCAARLKRVYFRKRNLLEIYYQVVYLSLIGKIIYFDIEVTESLESY